VVEENRFAYAAVMQLRTGEASRPCRLVTLTGPSGVGKSHIARQLVREALLENASVIDMHLTAAEFAAQFASASEGGCIPEFQQSFRKADLLVMEDLQALEGRVETQQQLLALIDEVIGRGGRVLVTANQPVGELRLPAKLVNRCHGGVCAEIAMPGQASRTTLLSHFANALNLPVPEDVLRVMAQHLPVSPRELHGALLNLMTKADGNRKRIDLQSALTIIKDAGEVAGPSLSDISRAVAGEFNVSVAMMRSPGRVQSTVIARQTAMYLGRELAGRSFAQIGDYFGGRNHATVLHACRRAAEQMAESPEYAQRVRNVRQTLRANGFRLCEQSVETESAAVE
jgi:chromosomal replication initiator protein